MGAGETCGGRSLMDWGGGQSWSATSPRNTNQMSRLSVPSHPVSASPPLLASLPRRGQPEAEGGHPEEHRDGPGGGDAQPDTAPGQPRVHRGQHEQLRLRGQVSVGPAGSCWPSWPSVFSGVGWEGLGLGGALGRAPGPSRLQKGGDEARNLRGRVRQPLW